MPELSTARACASGKGNLLWESVDNLLKGFVQGGGRQAFPGTNFKDSDISFGVLWYNRICKTRSQPSSCDGLHQGDCWPHLVTGHLGAAHPCFKLC